jgi:chromate transporter
MHDEPAEETPAGTTPLREIAALFLRLGFTAFGGPAAHIALMKDEAVNRRGWLTEAGFLDLIGATNLIPGPNSTEIAIHLGYLRGRWAGLAVAGLCFIVPAALLVSGFAWAYTRYGTLPAVGGVLYSVKPVVVAVVLQAIWGLAKPALRTRGLALLGAAALALALVGVPPLYLLFGAGTLAGVARWAGSRRAGETPLPARALLPLLGVAGALVVLPTLLTALLPAPSGAVPFGLGPLFLFFLKVGSVLYGSGYVLLAFLRDQLVTQWHWLTEAQLLDAVAVGQVTPGPVFTTATFVGFLLGGPAGAAVATLGIFLPSFVLVALSGPLVPRIRRAPLAAAFLDGVNAAALALMAAVVWDLGRAALVDAPTVALTLLSAVLLVRCKANSAWLIVGAAALGAVAAALGWRPGAG